MKVLKFGGSSVASAANMNKVISIVNGSLKQGSLVLVVSAAGGVTDALLQLGGQAADGDADYTVLLKKLEDRHLDIVRELLPVQHQSSTLSLVKKIFNELTAICEGLYQLREWSPRIRDRVAAYGEILSSQIITACLQLHTVQAIWADARALIVTNDQYGNALVDFHVTNSRIAGYFGETAASVYVVPGFIAATADNQTTTLGRGGSDYTAAIFAAAISAPVLEIWTDVSGMMTADPRIVPHAKPIPRISYQEAMELSHFGAKIIYPPTIQPVMKKQIPVAVKNTFAPEAPGTLIEQTAPQAEGFIRGISSIGSISLLSLEGSGMVGIPGFSKRLFETLADQRVNVILITQSSSEHSICVGINEADVLKAKRAIDQAFSNEIQSGKLEPLQVETGLSVIALVGEQMKSHPGVSGKMFGALGRNGINVRAIAQGSSEKNISAVLASADVRKALNVLHEAFFETSYQQLNIFIVGVGNVGAKLIAQLQQQAQFLLEQLRLQIQVVGLCNSRKMLIREEGIDLQNWKQVLDEGDAADIDVFVETIRHSNLRNSVLVDVTASESVAQVYGRLLEKSVSVVACNKIACSASYSYYAGLKKLARDYNASFLFETNVGAGLPVIGTLNDLLRSGDKIRRIQAVLSGTLNFVFNHYDTTKPFAEIVRQAQAEGYTEPDPRLDLGGTDVMRKIMILAREAGQVLEMEDISNQRFLPDTCMQGTVADFYTAMLTAEEHFRSLYQAARDKNAKLKFVATWEAGKARVGLEQVREESDFYHLYGKDNLVLFYTDRYPEQPLVIKGAGAGAEVTASGVFADIIRVSNR